MYKTLYLYIRSKLLEMNILNLKPKMPRYKI